MTVSAQIIEVINDLCAKFGIVIDWSAENVLPTFEALTQKVVKWEFASSVVWLLFAMLCSLSGWAIVFLVAKKGKSVFGGDFFFVVGMAVFFAIVGSIIFCCVIMTQIFDLVECGVFPEKVVFDYITGLIGA